MDVRVLDDVGHFAEVADHFLRQERFSANVVATYVDAICRGVRQVPVGAAWIAVEHAGDVRGIAMHTPPFPLFLPRLDPLVVDSLAHALADRGRPLPGVTGESVSVARFADVWLDRTGQLSRCRRSNRMYVLEELRPPDGVSGEARPARRSDAGLVAQWVSAFHDEATPGAPSDEWPAWARRRIEGEELWLWIDGSEPVAMSGRSPAAVGVSRIQPVYTPSDRRRRGYGAAVTAVATRGAIEAGADNVVLYTDLANPVSNSIYQAIGYVPDHDAEERAFVE